MPNLIQSIQQASVKGHAVAIVFGVLSATAVKFLADPHVVAFVHQHWYLSYVQALVSGIIISLVAYYRTQEEK